MSKTNSTRRCPIFWQRLKQILYRIYEYEVLWWIISITGVSVIVAGAFWRLSVDLQDSQKSIVMIAYDLIFILSCAAVALIAFRKRWDWLLWTAVISGVLLIGLFLSWVYWEGLHGVEDSVSTTIRNLGLVVGGAVAILLALWRSTVAERQADTARRQADTAQQSLLNERYQRAAEMLGSEVLSVRLAGIYALRRLAEENLEKYHVEIMRLFCAFARNPTRDEEVNVRGEPQFMMSSLREDVQEIMTIIGKRNKASMDVEKISEGFLLDLRGANLAGAYLVRANLADADMRNANLVGANFMYADLSDAILFNAAMSNQQSQDQDLMGAVQSRLRFKGTNISNTSFSYNGVYPARGLSQEQLDRAYADPCNPPKLDGVVDPVTGKPLVWREQSCKDE